MRQLKLLEGICTVFDLNLNDKTGIGIIFRGGSVAVDVFGFWLRSDAMYTAQVEISRKVSIDSNNNAPA